MALNAHSDFTSLLLTSLHFTSQSNRMSNGATVSQCSAQTGAAPRLADRIGSDRLSERNVTERNGTGAVAFAGAHNGSGKGSAVTRKLLGGLARAPAPAAGRAARLFRREFRVAA